MKSAAADSSHLSEIYDVYNAAINGLNPFGPNTIAMGNVAYNAHMFYAPLPHLFSGGLMYLFHNIGMTAVVAMKTTDIIFIAISGFYSYALGKRMTKSNIGGIILCGEVFRICMRQMPFTPGEGVGNAYGSRLPR